ncbi:acyl-CoA reductase [Amycolatopsis pithecellobii]|uniref:long-chain-fatty-acyl-CoA reductase n=1 Tax=Amycolatopsis pithecellobii TaxID=664692 RepID=A0A6N7YWM7_9PSEU|nr:acyl-CoA reductase [Amycolatopsis pithecellobii]MTD56332.1 gamma-glutamyl phosphate reductase [Amycolatopsis pithecellobii]
MTELTVGDERVVAFLDRFGRRLLALGRRYPELASLGFFLRRAETERQLSRLDGMRRPRGVVFHVPPANVDTVFVYSWALSALAGNTNVVRISPRAGAAARAILDVWHELEEPVIARTQQMITYDRDDELTAELSAAADLRVLWGGDDSVTALRKFPLAPHARDLTFPDRSSFAIVSVAGWQRASARERRAAVEAFFTDAYWFDQAACSSPRGVFWVGDGDPSAEFRALLVSVAREKGHVTDSAMAVQKRVSTYGAAADGRVEKIVFDSAAVTSLESPDIVRDWLGVGVFTHSRVSSLAELVPKVRRKDQTVTHFGFGYEELAEFAASAGVDRIVPFGSALRFSPVWDGYDLLAEFTKLITVTV